MKNETPSKLLREDKSQKLDYTYLVELLPVINRVIERLQEGAVKYDRLNWRNCEDPQTYKESAIRHMMQYLSGEKDEDHAVAAIINLIILVDLEVQEDAV